MKKIMSMFLILTCILSFSSMFLNSNILSANENKELTEIINKQQKVKKFQTDVRLKIKNSATQESTFEFTYYYHEPDLVHLETDDFVLLPSDPLKSLQPEFLKLDNYTLSLEKESISENNKIQVYSMKPINETENYWLKIWINIVEKNIEKAKVFFLIPNYKKEFSLNIKYKQVNEYSMPAYVEGNIAIPNKFGINGKIKEFKDGYIYLELDNYKINKDFSNNIMKKLKNKN